MEMPRNLELREALPKSPAGKTLKIKLREAAPA
jgi:acyl-CoA synthetase (AMP-forming)/AMP-acid ligase II